jgi:hypothetical protein
MTDNGVPLGLRPMTPQRQLSSMSGLVPLNATATRALGLGGSRTPAARPLSFAGTPQGTRSVADAANANATAANFTATAANFPGSAANATAANATAANATTSAGGVTGMINMAGTTPADALPSGLEALGGAAPGAPAGAAAAERQWLQALVAKSQEKQPPWWQTAPNRISNVSFAVFVLLLLLWSITRPTFVTAEDAEGRPQLSLWRLFGWSAFGGGLVFTVPLWLKVKGAA